tara:strand:+ start:144 stop:605 length:462 start_codon:yes stop_codon:yes gene_type:complete
MKKLLLLSALLIFACSSDSEGTETFLERYDEVVWGYPSVVDPNDPFSNIGCFFEDPYTNTFFLTNNPPSQLGYDIFDPLLGCNTISFSNPNYIIVQNSENIFSYTYEESDGTHIRTYTVSEDGNTLVLEDENCITPQIQFTRIECADDCTPCN